MFAAQFTDSIDICVVLLSDLFCTHTINRKTINTLLQWNSIFFAITNIPGDIFVYKHGVRNMMAFAYALIAPFEVVVCGITGKFVAHSVVLCDAVETKHRAFAFSSECVDLISRCRLTDWKECIATCFVSISNEPL